jgi:ABC-type bacteriocin/lantibiotic exporter with double-glycine peptidase domain
MKSSPFPYVIITTLLLITVTIMATLNFSFTWVFYLTVIGQIAVVLMVYKTLKEKYTTNKTFEHYYQDHPIESFKYEQE